MLARSDSKFSCTATNAAFRTRQTGAGAFSVQRQIMNVFCKSHSHHGHKLHSLSKNNKKNKTFPKDNLREDSKTLANQLNSMPQKEKRENLQELTIFHHYHRHEKKLHKNSIETHCNREIEPCVR
jgi:hypothetical protein